MATAAIIHHFEDSTKERKYKKWEKRKYNYIIFAYKIVCLENVICRQSTKIKDLGHSKCIKVSVFFFFISKNDLEIEIGKYCMHSWCYSYLCAVGNYVGY